MKILCGGPVSEDQDIFDAHIASLRMQGEMDYKGIDNSPQPLVAPTGFNSVEWTHVESLGEYKERKVRWNAARMDFVGYLREEMRYAALDGGYDYLFMVDTDLILGPGTLNKLLEAKKDFIAGAFWTKLRPWRQYRWVNAFDMLELPVGGKQWKNYELEFQRKLRTGGVHQVAITGACSLISRHALARISYRPWLNVRGEDTYLALSAREAGVPLFLHCDVEIEHRRRR